MFPNSGIPEPFIIVIDELPDNVEFVSASPGCIFDSDENIVACQVNNPSNTVGATASVTIVVSPTECGTFTNTAIIPFRPLSVAEQLRAEQQTAEELLEQIPAEDLVTGQQIDEESVDFTVVGCEQPEPEPEPEPQPEPQPQQPAAPITQDSDQESEAGEIDQSFEVS